MFGLSSRSGQRKEPTWTQAPSNNNPQSEPVWQDASANKTAYEPSRVQAGTVEKKIFIQSLMGVWGSGRDWSVGRGLSVFAHGGCGRRADGS